MIAQEAVDARVTILLHLDRLRGFRFSERLMLLGGWADAIEGTDVDPLRDVRRAFIAARASHEGQVAVVVQHTADEDRVARSIAAMHARFRQARPERAALASARGPAAGDALDARTETAPPSPHLAGTDDYWSRVDALFPDPSRLPFPAAYHLVRTDTSRGEPALVAAPHPGLIAVVPPERIFAVFRMTEVAGLPRPVAGEAMVLRAWDPGSSIQNGLWWSSDVRYADAVLAFDGAGNTTLSFRALCTSPRAAREQAERMTLQIEEAQSISLGGARLRLFDFVQFRAEDDRVKMRTHLHADEVDWIMAMTMRSM